MGGPGRVGHVIGVDAGGTSLRAALAPAAGGPVLATAAAGAGNARLVPEDVLTGRLARVLAEVLTAADPGSVRAVVAGFAGAGAPEHPDDPGRLSAERSMAAALRHAGVQGAAVQVVGDIDVAFAGAPGTPADGLGPVSSWPSAPRRPARTLGAQRHRTGGSAT
ncbi:hypothetical protein ACFQLX_00125 [Streptomyces polyrhachis]|uniref:ATPase BadF/BadG/BcrA/BcrD type domain-containing protein n=1 Tax=Streptomyces polyrhachis TaxID=1282885 RepID=A0ABW2GC74_9ACTN